MNSRTAFLMALLLAACGGGPVGGDTTPPSDTPPAFTLDGSWTLSSGVVDGNPLIPVSGREPTLSVDPEAQRAFGTTGCNTYSGTMAIADAGWLIWEGGLAVTEVGCERDVMEVEARFLAALTRTDRVEIDGDSMALTDGDRSVVLEFVANPPKADAALGGTQWVLTGFVNGDTASSIREGTAPTLFVDLESGSIRGNGGCNDFGARVAVDGERLVVSEMIYTEIACEEPIMAQEAEYFASLLAATGWTIEGTNLTIDTGSGGSLTFTARS